VQVNRIEYGAEKLMNVHGQTVLVTGATGNQGGATARHLLAGGWRVRALVRDGTAPAAAALAAVGAELVVGNLDDRASVDAAMRGAAPTASSPPTPTSSPRARTSRMPPRPPVSSTSCTPRWAAPRARTGFYVEQGWGPIEKWQIEEHIHDLGILATILRPAGFMEDFTSPARFFQKGSLNVPWRDDLVMQLIAIDDIGAFAAMAFAHPDQYLSRSLEITGDRLTAPQIAGALSAAAGRPVPHTQVPLEILWDHSPEAAKVFTWANATYYDTDLAPLKKAFPDLTNFGTWLDRSGQTRLMTQLQTLPE
jgi:uncharacterized protein YbjT (DUF2867 family)